MRKITRNKRRTGSAIIQNGYYNGPTALSLIKPSTYRGWPGYSLQRARFNETRSDIWGKVFMPLPFISWNTDSIGNKRQASLLCLSFFLSRSRYLYALVRTRVRELFYFTLFYSLNRCTLPSCNVRTIFGQHFLFSTLETGSWTSPRSWRDLALVNFSRQIFVLPEEPFKGFIWKTDFRCIIR